MKKAGSNALRCPENGCTAVLSTYTSPKGTRSLRYNAWQDCGHHHWAPVGGGGQMSEQHRWLQRRLVAMTRSMGFEPVAEHPATRADVYVPDKRLAIEVQLRPTQFQQRSAARRAAGAAGVLWMFSPDALPARRQYVVFEQPAVRWRAVDRQTWESVEPWDDPSTNRDALVQVYGTVVVPSRGSDGQVLTTRAMSGYQFLKEVLDGERVWVPPGTPGMPKSPQGLVRGGWVRPEELRAAVDAAARQQEPDGHAAQQETVSQVTPQVAVQAEPEPDITAGIDHSPAHIEQDESDTEDQGDEPQDIRPAPDEDSETSAQEPTRPPDRRVGASAGLVRRMLRWVRGRPSDEFSDAG